MEWLRGLGGHRRPPEEMTSEHFTLEMRKLGSGTQGGVPQQKGPQEEERGAQVRSGAQSVTGKQKRRKLKGLGQGRSVTVTTNWSLGGRRKGSGRTQQEQTDPVNVFFSKITWLLWRG